MTTAFIRQSLETALMAVTDTTTIDTSFDGSVGSGTDGRPYQDVTIMFSKPDNPTMSPGFHRDKGIFQINLYYPLNFGPGAAQTRADAIIAAFPRGLSFTSAKISLIIDGTPYLSAGRVDGNRWMVPVKIPFFANVFE